MGDILYRIEQKLIHKDLDAVKEFLKSAFEDFHGKDLKRFFEIILRLKSDYIYQIICNDEELTIYCLEITSSNYYARKIIFTLAQNGVSSEKIAEYIKQIKTSLKKRGASFPTRMFNQQMRKESKEYNITTDLINEILQNAR